MKIIAIDLGKFNSVALILNQATQQKHFQSTPTTPQDFHDLLTEYQPDHLLIEVGAQAGWISELCQMLDIELHAANTRHAAWMWKYTKRKTDKDDAQKLLDIFLMGQLDEVHIPTRQTRQWRQLIHTRHFYIKQRTQIANAIRSLLQQQGGTVPAGHQAWTREGLAHLSRQCRTLNQCSADELWRGILREYLRTLRQLNASVKKLELQLRHISKHNKQVNRLKTIPGVGERLAEMVVAVIDDPHRFKKAKQVAAYAGLVPKLYESGTMHRQGRITKAGHPLLRGLLVEVSWLMLRYNPVLKAFYDRVCGGVKSRRKIAVVALARKLITICWAMMRDEKDWDVKRCGAVLS